MKRQSSKRKSSTSRVAVIMGSDSDLPVMQGAIEALSYFDIAHEVKIVSAHRTPEMMLKFAKSAADEGYQVIIAGAGGAAHLPGMVASMTALPVIGVPVVVGSLEGLDALLSIAQMPKGVPVATMAINNSFNAGLLAARILASAEHTRPLETSGAKKQNAGSGLVAKLNQFTKDQEKKVLKANQRLARIKAKAKR